MHYIVISLTFWNWTLHHTSRFRYNYELLPALKYITFFRLDFATIRPKFCKQTPKYIYFLWTNYSHTPSIFLCSFIFFIKDFLWSFPIITFIRDSRWGKRLPYYNTWLPVGERKILFNTETHLHACTYILHLCG